jgi:hypothetical protein
MLLLVYILKKKIEKNEFILTVEILAIDLVPSTRAFPLAVHSGNFCTSISIFSLLFRDDPKFSHHHLWGCEFGSFFFKDFTLL